MASVINFVIDKFVWFMCGVILILFVIIGRYADKTNFGEGKKIVKVKKKKKDMIDSLEVPEKDESSNEISSTSVESIEKKDTEPKKNDNLSNETEKNETIEINTVDLSNSSNSLQDSNENSTIISKEEPVEESKDESIIEKIANENKAARDELDELLPEKDVLDDDLFQDLDDMSPIDFKIKKDSFKKITDLDDVSLPNISSGRKNRKQIWK